MKELMKELGDLACKLIGMLLVGASTGAGVLIGMHVVNMILY